MEVQKYLLSGHALIAFQLYAFVVVVACVDPNLPHRLLSNHERQCCFFIVDKVTAFQQASIEETRQLQTIFNLLMLLTGKLKFLGSGMDRTCFPTLLDGIRSVDLLG